MGNILGPCILCLGNFITITTNKSTLSVCAEYFEGLQCLESGALKQSPGGDPGACDLLGGYAQEERVGRGGWGREGAEARM